VRQAINELVKPYGLTTLQLRNGLVSAVRALHAGFPPK